MSQTIEMEMEMAKGFFLCTMAWYKDRGREGLLLNGVENQTEAQQHCQLNPKLVWLMGGWIAIFGCLTSS